MNTPQAIITILCAMAVALVVWVMTKMNGMKSKLDSVELFNFYFTTGVESNSTELRLVLIRLWLESDNDVFDRPLFGLEMQAGQGAFSIMFVNVLRYYRYQGDGTLANVRHLSLFGKRVWERGITRNKV